MLADTLPFVMPDTSSCATASPAAWMAGGGAGAGGAGLRYWSHRAFERWHAGAHDRRLAKTLWSPATGSWPRATNSAAPEVRRLPPPADPVSQAGRPGSARAARRELGPARPPPANRALPVPHQHPRHRPQAGDQLPPPGEQVRRGPGRDQRGRQPPQGCIRWAGEARRGRVFASASQAASCALKSAGPANVRPGRNERSR
jgi:hypothetical protein